MADTPEGHAAIQRDLHRLENGLMGTLCSSGREEGSSPPGEEQGHTPGRAGAAQLGSSLACREGPGDPGGHQAGRE